MVACCQVAMERWTEIMQMSILIFILEGIEITSESVENAVLTIDVKGANAVKCPNGATFDLVSRSCKHGNHSIVLGCQLYCNPHFGMFVFPNNLDECPYPEQFSDVTHRCENFTKVTCGSRPQVKYYCKFCFYCIAKYKIKQKNPAKKNTPRK